MIDPDDPRTWPPSARAYLARREPVAAKTPAHQRLAAYVRAQGRVTFAEFMRQALYDPEEGYYRSLQERIGQRGDFLTSPETHPVFGALMARWLRTRWQALGEPLPFIVVEAGGGTGAAAEQILSAAERWPAFAEALRYVLLEPGAAPAVRQRDRLARFGERVQWASVWQDLPPGIAVIWANEVLDALPFHRVRRERDRLVELWVSCQPDGADGFHEEPGPLSTPEIAKCFERLGIQPAEGIPVEVNLEASAWLRAAAGAMSRGFILLLDYGASAGALYGDPARAGTLRTYRRHMLGVDPFVHIGEQDLTADVDFTSLLHVAEEAGLQVAAFIDQRRFLLELGLRDWLRRPPAPGVPGHLRLLELIDPSGLGRIKVLELHKGDPFRVCAAERTRVD